MTDLDAVRRQIVVNPADDVARLAWARSLHSLPPLPEPAR